MIAKIIPALKHAPKMVKLPGAEKQQLAWGFGAFMEGMAGFGTAVAIPAAMMVAVGFDPLKSIIACLVANSVPTTFGSIGIPTTTLASLTSLDPSHLGTFISVQLFLLNLIAPFFVVSGGGHPSPGDADPRRADLRRRPGGAGYVSGSSCSCHCSSFCSISCSKG